MVFAPFNSASTLLTHCANSLVCMSLILGAIEEQSGYAYYQDIIFINWFVAGKPAIPPFTPNLLGCVTVDSTNFGICHTFTAHTSIFIVAMLELICQ